MRSARMSRICEVTCVALVVLLALVLAGCGSGASSGDDEGATSTSAGGATSVTTPDDAATTSTAPTDGTSSTETPSTDTNGEALSSAETLQPDGTIKAMGYIDRVWEEGGARHISIDYAEMLTGEEAKAAAVEAGKIEPGEDLPNDYFIRNVNTKLREFVVSDSVAITTATRWVDGDDMGAPCTWEDFMSFWGPGLGDGESHLHNMPWWIVRDGDTVISIDEQYIP